MKLGTRSLLYGGHQFLVHPLFVALAWRRLYGFPRHPLLWLAFLVHDWGYWGRAHMDDEDGENHPELGARILGLFGDRWYRFVRYHSRFLAARDGVPISRLCAADKLAVAITPRWLYLPLVRLTGEIREYQALAVHGKYAAHQLRTATDRAWFADMQRVLRAWVANHQKGAYP